MSEVLVLGVPDPDGEVVLIRPPDNILQAGPIMTDVLANTFTSEYAMLLHSRSVKVTFREPTAWTLDGEDGGKHTAVLCENRPHSIQMIVNEL